MEKKQWLKFKSGSDIRGIGLGDESNPLYLSNEVVSRCAAGFLLFLCKKQNKKPDELKISVGHDPRLSAERIKTAVIDSLAKRGAKVVDCGLSSTPAMFFSIGGLSCSGAIQLTASHHPADKNGLKFFTPSGGLDGENIEEILNFAYENPQGEAAMPGSVTKVNFMKDYSKMLRETIKRGVNAKDYDRPLKGKKIVVAAGNGAGGFFATEVLEMLGADISGSLHLEPNGSFPNILPNPENPEFMQLGCNAVKESDADFGVVFDTDVDRSGCVGKGGVAFGRNRLVALASAIALEKCSGATIVTDSTTSDGLAKFIREQGGVHLRYKRGYRNVINKQIELCENGTDCPLAMETSGHAAFSENYFLDDGAYLAVKFIIKMAEMAERGEALENLIASLEEPAEEKELRLKITAEDFKSCGQRLIDSVIEEAENHSGWTPAKDNYEGIRVSVNKKNGNGWFLFRLSVHDPLIVLNLESNEIGGIKKMLNEILSLFGKTKEIDFSTLEIG